MTKSSAPKVPSRKARSTRHKIVAKVAPRKPGDAIAKAASRDIGKARDKHQKTAPKVAAERVHSSRKTAWAVAGETPRETHRDAAARFEQLRAVQVPDTLRALAERNVAQTRALYERSETALKSALEGWEKSFNAAGQGAVALNTKIIDIAGRNIKNGFDLATGLAAAKNFAEVMELQAAYWRKQFRVLGPHD
jgi:hypothetical protein